MKYFHLQQHMDGPRKYHVQQSQSERERQILYDVIYLWNLKIIQMNLHTKPKQTHKHRKQTYVYQKGRRGKNQEYGINRHRLLYIKQMSKKDLLQHSKLWLSGKESACQCRRHGFSSWVGKIPWRRKWQFTPEFLPGKSHRQRSLKGYSLRVAKESDMTQ